MTTKTVFDENEDPDRGVASGVWVFAMVARSWRRNGWPTTTSGYWLRSCGEVPISRTAREAGSLGVCRCDGLGSRSSVRHEHDQRECGVGYGVEEIERLERAEFR